MVKTGCCLQIMVKHFYRYIIQFDFSRGYVNMSMLVIHLILTMCFN